MQIHNWSEQTVGCSCKLLWAKCPSKILMLRWKFAKLRARKGTSSLTVSPLFMQWFMLSQVFKSIRAYTMHGSNVHEYLHYRYVALPLLHVSALLKKILLCFHCLLCILLLGCLPDAYRKWWPKQKCSLCPAKNFLWAPTQVLSTLYMCVYSTLSSNPTVRHNLTWKYSVYLEIDFKLKIKTNII